MSGVAWFGGVGWGGVGGWVGVGWWVGGWVWFGYMPPPACFVGIFLVCFVFGVGVVRRLFCRVIVIPARPENNSTVVEKHGILCPRFCT